jgi:hypothetical protein
VDEMHASAVRHYFTTAPAAGTKASEKHERSMWLRWTTVHISMVWESGADYCWQVLRSISLLLLHE